MRAALRRRDRVHFVDTDPRPVEQEEREQVAIGEALHELAERQAVETQKAGFESAEVLQFRQWLFGLTQEDLEQEAFRRRINPFQQHRNAVIQLIIDHDHPPVVGRGWAPNGAGTSGDEKTDRLRQMQYDSDPAMRRNYENKEG